MYANVYLAYLALCILHFGNIGSRLVKARASLTLRLFLFFHLVRAALSLVVIRVGAATISKANASILVGLRAVVFEARKPVLNDGHNAYRTIS